MTWTVERADPVVSLAFTRPPSNYMDFGSMIDLGDLLDRLAEETEQVKVVLLASGLDDKFIDHAELSDLVKAGEGRASETELGSWTRALNLLEEIPQPTVAAIDGLASGGGNEIALACTLRIGSERARLQQPEVTVGIIPGGGGSVRLPRLVGPGAAAQAILTGKAFDADQALRVGWLNAILPSDGFKQHALQYAEAIADSPGPALNAAKKSIVRGSRIAFADAIALERQLFGSLSATSDALKQRASDTNTAAPATT